MKTGKVLDDTFIEDVLSKNDKVSTKAQISNPWSTEEFNREREKLFYLALQMTKEFVLSSKSCRTNLCILGQYWGFRTENDTDRIKFHKQDAVKGFVNSNIVNVAATRAKYRFYMVGDQKVWGKNEYVNEAKSIMDRLLIEDAEENN